MEDRVVIALAIAIAMVMALIWFVTRKVKQRRAFKLRQAGQGKSIKPISVVPAE
jgi:flagellar biogenesis protein FliO